MTLDPELVQILVCPNDRGEIDYREDDQVIVCRTCGYRYERQDGFMVGAITINTILLASYTFSCHSLRHLVGGRKDEVSGNALRSGCYAACSSLNRRHQVFAWLSLCSVGFADIYVRLCSMGIWTDYRLL